MSAFSIRKQSPHQSDKKSPSVAIKSRQQAAHDINKRRTLLQDNSWIKKRPEEESADENYGRAVLNQYKSQDSLHSSSTNEKEDQKAILGRYRSDTTLDRIPAGSDTDKINKSPTLNHKQNNRQFWTPDAASTNTAVTSPIKKKRQSWMPPPVSSSKTPTEAVESKRSLSVLKTEQRPVSSMSSHLRMADSSAILRKGVQHHGTTSENSEAPKTAALSSEQVNPQKSKTNADDQATARESKAAKTADQNSAGPMMLNFTQSQDLDNLSKANPSSFTSDKKGKDISDLTEKNTAEQKNKRDKDLGDHTEVKSADDKSKRWIIEKAYENPPRAPNNLSETHYSSDSERKTSKSSLGAYEENITGNTIKTVYSTSDRSIIGKDICTYCRKPLGIDAKMILDALQIHCHSTCFKCEVCKRPLEDLKAGDSIWIYKQTVHCEPCYSKVKENWIY